MNEIPLTLASFYQAFQKEQELNTRRHGVTHGRISVLSRAISVLIQELPEQSDTLKDLAGILKADQRIGEEVSAEVESHLETLKGLHDEMEGALRAIKALGSAG